MPHGTENKGIKMKTYKILYKLTCGDWSLFNEGPYDEEIVDVWVDDFSSMYYPAEFKKEEIVFYPNLLEETDLYAFDLKKEA